MLFKRLHFKKFVKYYQDTVALVPLFGSSTQKAVYSTLCQLNNRNKLSAFTEKLSSILTSSTLLFSTAQTMAKSKYEYVKHFEVEDHCLRNCWIVVRVDGKSFHRFTEAHHYIKPNDGRGLNLMTKAAQSVMNDLSEIILAYGQSDEYSFVFHKDCTVYNRRASKLVTNVVSLFSSSFTFYWSQFFPDQTLKYPPAFDARVVLYPSQENLKDYLSWRQADCHINNLYNTCFWKLVHEKGLTPEQAGEWLKGTQSRDKNELLFKEFNTNYNNLPELYRKGTVIIRQKHAELSEPESQASRRSSESGKDKLCSTVVLHTDIISKKFWEEYPHILKDY